MSNGIGSSDFSSMFGAGLGGAFGAGAGIPGLGMDLGTGIPGQVPSNEGFQDLLSLVSDLEIADTQSQGLGAAVNGLLEGQDDKASRELALAANQSALEMAMMQGQNPAAMANNTVGRSDVGNPTSETLSPIQSNADLVMGMQDLSLKGQMHLEQAKQHRQTHDLEAVAEWANALANGDIKSVEVGPAPSAPMPALFAEGAQAQMLAEKSSGSSAGKLAGEGPEPGVNKTSGADGSAKIAAANVASAEKLEVVGSAKRGGDQHMGQDERKSGSELLLDSFTAGAVSSHGKPAGFGAVVANASSLGDTQDPRVSRESLSFVADKIDALKSQGGGTLKVQMSPGDLGNIEIRVSMRGGAVQVQLSADNPATLEALNAQKGDLMARLSAKGSASLSLGAMSSPSLGGSVTAADAGSSLGASQSSGTLARNAANASQVSSDQMLTLHTGKASEGQRVQEMQLNRTESTQRHGDVASSHGAAMADADGASGSRDSSGSSGGGRESGRDSGRDFGEGFNRGERQAERGPDRDERRGRALDRWEDLFEKKSA